MPTTPAVTDWGTAIMTSLASALALLLGGIPKIIGFLVILIIGWLIASAIATAVAALLRTVKCAARLASGAVRRESRGACFPRR